MLTILSYIFLSIIIIPLILILLILAFGLSFIARIIRPSYPGSKYPGSTYSRTPGQKPKGTIEVLPAETEDADHEEKPDKFKGNAKDRRVGKDKFREL